MSLQKAVANALSFAHLTGFRRKSRAAAEGDDKPDEKDKDAEGDDDGDEEGDGKPDHDGDEPMSEDDDGGGENAEADDDEPADKEKDKKEAKRAAARGSKPVAKTHAQGVAAGRADERARCAAIFASPAAARNVVLAAELAFNTDMAAERAIAVLSKVPSQASADRASRNPHGVSRSGAETPPSGAIASSWDAAMQKAAGTYRKR